MFFVRFSSGIYVYMRWACLPSFDRLYTVAERHRACRAHIVNHLRFLMDYLLLPNGQRHFLS